MAENWVDPERMKKSAGGFDTQADDIRKLAQRARELGDPERVRAAAGDDPDGHKFAKTHLELAGQVFDGIDLWGKSVKATGDGIRAAAHTYTKAEDNATEAASRLRRAGSSGGGAEASLRVAAHGPDSPLWENDGEAHTPPVLLSGSGEAEGTSRTGEVDGAPASARVAARGGSPDGPPVVGAAVLPGEPLKPVDGPPVAPGQPLVLVDDAGVPAGPRGHDDLIAPSASTSTHSFAERDD